MIVLFRENIPPPAEKMVHLSKFGKWHNTEEFKHS